MTLTSLMLLKLRRIALIDKILLLYPLLICSNLIIRIVFFSAFSSYNCDLTGISFCGWIDLRFLYNRNFLSRLLLHFITTVMVFILMKRNM